MRALAAQQAGELTGVDVGDGDGVLAHQVLRQRFRLAEVAGQQWQIFDDEACGVDLVSFDVLCVDPVIADVRVRQGDDLLAVAGVSEDFLVAGDGGVETTSPTVVPVAPIELPIKTVPSASARMAGGKVPWIDKSTGFSGWLRSPGAC